MVAGIHNAGLTHSTYVAELFGMIEAYCMSILIRSRGGIIYQVVQFEISGITLNAMRQK